MEFRSAAAGDRGLDRSTLPVPASACPGSSAAGPFHGEPPPSSPFEWEAAARRERILRGELEFERRLVQELSRREFALHSGFGPVPSHSHGGFVPPPPPPPGTFFRPAAVPTPPMPLPLTPVVGAHPNWPPPAAMFGPWAGFGPRPLAGFGQPMLLDETRTTYLPPPEPTHQIQPSENSASEVLPLETKVCGAKRKTDGSSAATEPRKLQSASSAATEPTKLQSASSAATEPIKLQNARRDWSCALCQLSATSEALLNLHFEGKKHKAKLVQCATTEPIKLQNASRDWSCALCQLSATSEADLNQHLQGKKHEAKMAQCASTEPINLQNARRDWSCALCQVSATDEAGLKQHVEGKKHKAKLVQCGAIKVTDTNKSGLQVTAGNNNGVGPSDAHKEIHVLFEINGEMHQVVRNGDYVCERCGVSCANAAAMADHLRGEKHSLWKTARMNKEVKEGSAATCERKVSENSPTGISEEHKQEDTHMTRQFNGDNKDTEAVSKVSRNCETEQEGPDVHLLTVHQKSRKKANKNFLLKVHQKSRKKARKKANKKKAKKGVTSVKTADRTNQLNDAAGQRPIRDRKMSSKAFGPEWKN